VLAVEQSLCSSPDGADVTRHRIEFVLDVVVCPGLHDAVSCSHATACMLKGRPVSPAVGRIGDTDVPVDDDAAWLDGLHPTESSCLVDHSDSDLFAMVLAGPPLLSCLS